MPATIILAVVDDKYELPVYVADSPSDMERRLNLYPCSVKMALSREGTVYSKKLGEKLRFFQIPTAENAELSASV